MEGESVKKKVFISKLHEISQTTPTVLWNDSCSIKELTSSISHGALGATCNPVIVSNVLVQEWDIWKNRIPGNNLRESNRNGR